MDHPIRSSAGERRNVKQPVSATRLILNELERLVSDIGVKSNRCSLFLNRNIARSKTYSSLEQPSFTLPSTSHNRSQPTLSNSSSQTFAGGKNRPMIGACQASNARNSLRHFDGGSSQVSEVNLDLNTVEREDQLCNEFQFLDPDCSSASVKELEDVGPVASKFPRSSFLTQDFEDTFEFELPENRGPKQQEHNPDEKVVAKPELQSTLEHFHF